MSRIQHLAGEINRSLLRIYNRSGKTVLQESGAGVHSFWEGRFLGRPYLSASNVLDRTFEGTMTVQRSAD